VQAARRFEERQPLPEPIFTPATKAEMGDHDENISYDKMVDIIGADLATQVRDLAIRCTRRRPTTR
jgi:phosphoribosylaminoimidazole-succinocarboxamide synthase